MPGARVYEEHDKKPYSGMTAPQQYHRPQFYTEVEPRSYYEEPSMPPRYHQAPAPQRQPYYGVPGFHVPNFDIYDDDEPSMHEARRYETADVTPSKRPRNEKSFVNEGPAASSMNWQKVKRESSPPNRNQEPSRRTAPSSNVASTSHYPYTSTTQREYRDAPVSRNVPTHTVTSERGPTPQSSPAKTNFYGRNKNAPPTPAATETAVTSATPCKTLHTMESNDGEPTPVEKPRKREQPPGVHFLSGPISRVLKWESLRDLFPVVFEVIATLKSLRNADTHRELLLRDEAGPVLHVQFYEIDREMPRLEPGQMVRAVGRLTGRGRMQAFSVRVASKNEYASMQRISFVCHRAATQVLQKMSDAPPSQ
ncbi:hypothetical protein B566_EDAN010287 [Ephemera danica]|nr:hypothetical protein B566_EDAN010287 [Ephemera danica]